jgi:hypothetical protein
MATKKKSFDAVAESRRWRIRTGRKLRGLSFAQQQTLLRRTTKAFFTAKADAPVAAKPSRRASAHR